MVAAVPWKAATASLAVVVSLAIVAYAVLQSIHGQGDLTVTGSVVCESWQPVVGVWIAASTGQSDSGLAHLGPPDASGISYPIGAAGTYSYRLPHGGNLRRPRRMRRHRPALGLEQLLPAAVEPGRPPALR